MKVRVGDTTDEVEVGQYRALDKGALKGYFTIVDYPSGRKTTDCSHFAGGSGEWFNFPQKEIKPQDGGKSKYFPYVSFINHEYGDEYKSAVMKSIKQCKEANGEANTPKKQANPLQDDASAVWF